MLGDGRRVLWNGSPCLQAAQCEWGYLTARKRCQVADRSRPLWVLVIEAPDILIPAVNVASCVCPAGATIFFAL